MRFYFYFNFHVERTASGNSLSYHDTDSEQKLRKANKELKDEVAELKVKLEKVLKELSERTKECKLNVGNGGEVLSPDKTKSVEFVLDQ